MDKKEVNQLMKIAKKILSKSLYKKIKNVEDFSERKEVLKYSIKVNLEMKYEDLKHRVILLENQGKNIFFIIIKMRIFKSKINLFNATFKYEDFLNAIRFLNEVEKEIKNV